MGRQGWPLLAAHPQCAAGTAGAPRPAAACRSVCQRGRAYGAARSAPLLLCILRFNLTSLYKARMDAFAAFAAITAAGRILSGRDVSCII